MVNNSRLLVIRLPALSFFFPVCFNTKMIFLFCIQLSCHACMHEDVPLAEFMYIVFTHMPGESYHRQLRSLLLDLCYIF